MATIAEPPLQQRKTESHDARQQFLTVFDEIREEVLADPMLVQKDASEWMARMLDHNVPGGKLNRGMAVKDSLMMIMPDASEELQKQADFVGWAIEFLQVAFSSLYSTTPVQPAPAVDPYYCESACAYTDYMHPGHTEAVGVCRPIS